ARARSTPDWKYPRKLSIPCSLLLRNSPMKVALPFALALAFVSADTFADSAQQHAIKLDVRRAKLDNGLRVVLAPDHTSPTIAVDVIYDVGGRNEERGHAGFAHLFEHMMFQGSANVARGDHFKLVTSHGGTLNGTPRHTRTNPSRRLPR